MENAGDNQNTTSTPITSPNNAEQGESSGGPSSALVEGEVRFRKVFFHRPVCTNDPSGYRRNSIFSGSALTKKIQLVSTPKSPKWPRLVDRMDRCTHDPASKTATGASPILAVVANNVALLASIFSSNETHKFYSIVFYLLVVSLVIASSLILGVHPLLWYYKKRAAGINGTAQDAATAQENGESAGVVRFDSLIGVEGRETTRMGRFSLWPKRHYASKIVTAKFLRSILVHLLMICGVAILVFHLLGKSKVGN